MRQLVRSTLSSTFTVLLLGGAVISFFQYFPYKKPYEVLNPQAHYATQLGPETIRVGREFRVTKDETFYITRELIQCRNGEFIELRPPKCSQGSIMVRKELESSTVDYSADKHNVERDHEINGLQPGHYKLFNRICWWNNWINRDCLDLPVLDVEIFPDRY